MINGNVYEYNTNTGVAQTGAGMQLRKRVWRTRYFH
jgi:hypothetical protein